MEEKGGVGRTHLHPVRLHKKVSHPEKGGTEPGFLRENSREFPSEGILNIAFNRKRFIKSIMKAFLNKFSAMKYSEIKSRFSRQIGLFALLFYY